MAAWIQGMSNVRSHILYPGSLSIKGVFCGRKWGGMVQAIWGAGQQYQMNDSGFGLPFLLSLSEGLEASFDRMAVSSFIQSAFYQIRPVR